MYRLCQKNWYHLRGTEYVRKTDITWDEQGMSENWYHLRCTGYVRKIDITWEVQSMSEKLI